MLQPAAIVYFLKQTMHPGLGFAALFSVSIFHITASAGDIEIQPKVGGQNCQ